MTFYGNLHHQARPVVSVYRAGGMMRSLVLCAVVSYIGKCGFGSAEGTVREADETAKFHAFQAREL
jgi:hypothetical protein